MNRFNLSDKNEIEILSSDFSINYMKTVYKIGIDYLPSMVLAIS